MSEVRLQRFLSQAGVAARRKAELLITEGRVMVNGKVVRELGTKVHPTSDRVTVDGQAVVAEEHFYIVFNKPKGCITAVRDDRGRTTVMDYLPNLPASVAPVGRLDYYSEGVLLLTNDGELAAKLLAPKSHVPKTYHVKVWGHVSPKQIGMLRDGIKLEDGTVTQPAEVDELPAEGKHPWLQITLREGKSRQIHRMLEALGHTVQKLQRVAFANLTFHGLRVGDARELTQGEVNDLRTQVGLDHSSVSRGRWRAKREQTDRPRRDHERARVEHEAKAQGLPPPPPFDPDAEYTGPTRTARPGRDVATPPRAPRSTGAGRPASKPRPPGTKPKRPGVREAHPPRPSKGGSRTRGPRGPRR